MHVGLGKSDREQGELTGCSVALYLSRFHITSNNIVGLNSRLMKRNYKKGRHSPSNSLSVLRICLKEVEEEHESYSCRHMFSKYVYKSLDLLKAHLLQTVKYQSL